MKTKHLTMLAVCCIVTIFIVGIPFAQATEESLLNQGATSFVESVKETGFLTAANDEIIAVVDGWKITQADLDNRINEHEFFNKEEDISDIFNVLFEEAALYSQAEGLGVLATDVEVKQYVEDILKDRDVINFLKQNPIFNDSLYYYAFKFITYNNVYQYYLNEGRELGLISPSWTYNEDVLSCYPYGNPLC